MTYCMGWKRGRALMRFFLATVLVLGLLHLTVYYGFVTSLTVLFTAPLGRRNIYMVETSGSPSLTPRQACAVESGARQNPNINVVVYMTTTIIDVKYNHMAVLASIPNVNFVQLNLDQLFTGSRLESWYVEGKWKRSPFNVSHLSDAIRFLILYQNGGLYMDLDVVVAKSVNDLHNCSGMEDIDFVNTAVMTFDQGHFMLKLCLDELADHYDGSKWNYNGPGVFTRVLKRVCGGIAKLSDVSRDRCQGITIFPPQAFYPIPWQQWKDFFDTEHPDKVINKWKDSYVIHLWNKMSGNTKVVIGSKQPYEIAARMFCPATYKLSVKNGVF